MKTFTFTEDILERKGLLHLDLRQLPSELHLVQFIHEIQKHCVFATMDPDKTERVPDPKDTTGKKTVAHPQLKVCLAWSDKFDVVPTNSTQIPFYHPVFEIKDFKPVFKEFQKMVNLHKA